MTGIFGTEIHPIPAWLFSYSLRPYMRFLYVRPEICPLGDLSTPKIRLSPDSASRRAPLPFANPSHYRADSGFSPYRTCAHRAHQKTQSLLFLASGAETLRFFHQQQNWQSHFQYAVVIPLLRQWGRMPRRCPGRSGPGRTTGRKPRISLQKRADSIPVSAVYRGS